MIAYHPAVDQGSEEWLAMRRGMLTASEMHRILTPSLDPADNAKSRALLFELLGQRITGYTEPHYISDDMLRGQEDEITARALYAEHFCAVTECGFVVNDSYGVVIGYSPDGLVGSDGLIECKSRCMKFQMETILSGEVDANHVIQCQTGLLVTGRKWLDYVSYCGGLPMFVRRVFPCPKIHAAIVSAALEFDRRMSGAIERYLVIAADPRTIMTERTLEMEIAI